MLQFLLGKFNIFIVFIYIPEKSCYNIFIKGGRCNHILILSFSNLITNVI